MISFDYIALLDYEHLDNHFFLKSLAKELAKRPDKRGILLHADSPFTERIMQQGVMREEARIRAAKDLNHRLVALLADEGIPAIGLHPFQKELVSENGNVSESAWLSLPSIPVVILSTLMTEEGLSQRLHPLTHVLPILANSFEVQSLLGFSRIDSLQWNLHKIPDLYSEEGVLEQFSDFFETHIPAELRDMKGYRLCVPGVTGSASLWDGSLHVKELR